MHRAGKRGRLLGDSVFHNSKICDVRLEAGKDQGTCVWRSTALGHCEVLILASVSDPPYWCSAAMSVLQVRGTTAPVQDRQGRSAHLSLLSMGGNSNARLRACTSGTVRAAGSL